MIKPKQVVILGSTGSIGRMTLEVIDHLNKHFRVFGLVANSRWKLLLKQVNKFTPREVGLTNAQAAERLKASLRRKQARIYHSLEEIKQMVTHPAVDIVVSAISGAEGLLPTLWAVQAGKTIALANKESLVMAGDLLMSEARRRKAEIRPVDSEHSAIFQAGHCGKPGEIRRVILTASGGPFYRLPSRRLRSVSVKQALNHPTWQMGPKITIDSATLMNKALEIIEAKHLFGLSPRQIKVVIHPQCIVHSMVEFRDGSTMAQLGYPDMRLPIQFALTYPERLTRPLGNYNIISDEPLRLSFEEPDTAKFPALRLGYEVLRKGGTAGAVLNAANEEAVKLFLTKGIRFTDIAELTGRVLNRHRVVANPVLADILKADRWARAELLSLRAPNKKS